MFKCVACEAKDKEIEYLRNLVDRALVKHGMAPVLGDKAQGGEPMEAPDVPEKIESGADKIITYGGSDE
jgi:hypothetical protein